MGNVANIRSFGDVNMRVVTAALGVAQPTAPYPTAWGAGWYDLGLLDAASGITQSQSQQETKVYAVQGGAVARVLRSQFEKPFKVVCLETNLAVKSLMYPGTTVTTTGGVAEVQTITIAGTGTSGTWQINTEWGSLLALAYNITTANLILAFATVGVTVTCTGTPGSSYVVTFPATLGNVQTMTFVNNIAGATGITVATTTPGTTGTNTRPVFPSSAQNLRQFGIDLIDGSIATRLIVGNGEALSDVDVNYNVGVATVVGLTINPYLDVAGNFFTEIDNNEALSSGDFV